MIYALGVITGLLIALTIFMVMTYFRRLIEQKVTTIEKAVELKGPRPKGFIFDPPSEADELRAQIIAKNQHEGKDTKFEELL